ncbi:MAG: hypothetical protein GX883_06435 [Firmicutes bacterium]|nr:hypothetical protein [Bacillota bacterium]
MKGKIIPLNPRGQGEQGGSAVNESALPEAKLIQEVEQIIWKTASRAPAALRERLIAIAEKGERHCPTLFLLIALLRQIEPRQAYRLGASLEALHLALKTHREIMEADGGSIKEEILCGDFFFGLALTLAGNQPPVIQGMSEVITRFVDCSIDTSEGPAVLPGQCKNYLQKLCDGMASIYALSCTLGAWYAGLKTWQNEALSFYGLYLGIGLQIRREVDEFYDCLREKQPVFRARLPAIYLLGESPLRQKLAPLLNKRLSERERVLLLQEVKRLDPRAYLDRVIGNCFSKSAHFIGLLDESVDQKTLSSLKSLIS